MYANLPDMGTLKNLRRLCRYAIPKDPGSNPVELYFIFLISSRKGDSTEASEDLLL